MVDKRLKLEVDADPTYWNKEALIGTLLAPGLGTIVGAIMGKNRMERELEDGKRIEKPTRLNMDAVLGALLLPTVTAIAGFIASAAAFVVAGPEVASMGILATQAASLAAMPVGGYLGGGYGKETMKKEAALAEQQQKERELSQSIDHVKEKSQGLEQAHVQEKSTHFTDMVDAERAKQGELQK